MGDGDAGRCEPYRVEVRSDLASPWRRFGDGRSTLAEAEARARHAVAYHGRQARVVEQRVVLVRGLGQDGGPDQAFADFASRNLKAAARQAADTMATADGVVRASQASRMSSSEPEEPEQAMPDGLLFSERELWEDTRTWAPAERRRVREVLARLDRVRAAQRRRPARDTDLRDALAHIARVTVWLADDPADRVAYLQDVARDAIRPSVVSDPDDRRAVEAAADAGEPLDQARTILNQLADTDTQRQAIRHATVTDTAGCGHRMNSGAVSLTACGECGADPGDDCMAWRVLDATAAKIGGTSPLEAAMRDTSAEVDALLAEHGKSHGTDPLEDRVRAAEERYDERERLKADMRKPHGTDPWWRRLLHRPRQ